MNSKCRRKIGVNMNQDEIKVCMLRVLPKELQAESIRVALEENPDNVPENKNEATSAELASLIGKRWRPGRTIKVHFMGGDSFIQSKVRQFARQWESYANIYFAFVNDPNAEIRISFIQGGGSWSYLGTDCLTIDKSEPTMNFGWFTSDTSDTEFSRTVLHEFGHAMGSPHEHQSPEANIPWDIEAVKRFFGGPPNNWSDEVIYRNLFFKYSRNEAEFTSFDPESIMAYQIPNSLTIGDFEVKGNTTLSETDKQFIRKMYPFGVNEKDPQIVAGFLDRVAQPYYQGGEIR